MKITPLVLLYALLASVAITLFTWCWLVLHQFDLAKPWVQLPVGLWHTFEYPSLRRIALQSLALGFIPVGVALYLLGDWSASGERVLRGARIIAAEKLARRTRLKRRKGEAPVQVSVAGVPVPLQCESQHFLLVGSTGKGKTVALFELLRAALARRDRAVIVDPNGDAWARFAKKGDILLNPFDTRSPGWSPFNEIRHPYDYLAVAKSIVPDSSDPASQQWHGYAQQLLAETMRAMAQAGQTTTGDLVHWLTVESDSNLGAFLAGSAVNGLFDPNSAKALASTRFIVTSCLSSFQYLQPGDFSLRTWLETGKGNLYLVWREDMLDGLKPLLSSWVDILLAAVLSLPAENPRRLWLVLDELASLGHLNSLQSALTKGRKHGLRVVAALQSVSQLDAIYGTADATTLRSCFVNLLVLGGANADPATAKIMSDGLGEVEVERLHTTHNHGPSGATTSKSLQRVIEKLVLPGQLTSLAPLAGYLKFDGNYPVAEVRLTAVDYPKRTKAVMER